MDHKALFWKKKPSEKSLIATDRANANRNGNAEEIQDFQKDKAEREREILILKEKLSSALSECNARDDLAKRNAKMAKEALGGWEKVEVEAMLLKQQLDEVLIQKLAGEERLVKLDMALKECMQQLRFIREEKEQRIHDAVTKTLREFEMTRNLLEENLRNSNAKLSKLGAENSQLVNALVAKEKLIEDINGQKTCLEADSKALITRVESTEKQNVSLKYEVRMLEKEIDIRSEEREFNCYTADSAHKQHLESSKKILKLESECQRLRVLECKRLPGPASLAIMKSEVELLGRSTVEPRRRKSNLSSTGSMEFVADNDPDTPRRKIKLLSEQLCVTEEENRILKEALTKKNYELQFSQALYNHTASKLSDFEAQLERSSVGQVTLMPEGGGKDKVNTPGSRASVLFSETDHFRSGDEVGTPSWKSVAGSSDIDLMDDFVEMEKLATLSRKKLVNQSPILDTSDRVVDDERSLKKKATYEVRTNLRKSIQKVIDLIEGIGLLPKNVSGVAEKTSQTPGYTVRVFQWKTSELTSVLQNFIQTCNGLLTGKADLESFAQDLTSALDWVINHCFSLQDVSSMRDTIKKQCDWDETQSESEVEGGVISHCPEADKLRFSREQFLYSPKSVWSEHKVEEKETHNDRKEEKKKPSGELATLESGKNESEGGRQPLGVDNNEALSSQLQEAEKTAENLRMELQTMKKAETVIQNQISDHTTGESKVEVNDNCLQELETMHAESQSKPESVAHEENPNEVADEDDKKFRNVFEIATAPKKLVERKEAEALGEPKDLSFSKKIVTKPIARTTTLLDKMLAEDKTEYGGHNFPTTKDVICIPDSQKSSPHDDGVRDRGGKYLSSNNTSEKGEQIAGSFMALVPKKKKTGGGLWKKLLGRKKKR